MKKILLLCLFSILSIFSFANDWEFGSEGEHIIPLKGSAVAIKKEKITLKLTEDGMLVNVKFTFDSPNAENKIIGFVTPESGNNEDYEENYSKAKRKAEPLKIKNFKTVVNGKEVKSNVELLSKLLSRGVLDNNVIKEYVEEEKNFYNYVYYFNADFKQGENVVEHSYYYTGSYGIFQRDFAYVVTTISKWKNQTVEDFEPVDLDSAQNDPARSEEIRRQLDNARNPQPEAKLGIFARLKNFFANRFGKNKQQKQLPEPEQQMEQPVSNPHDDYVNSLKYDVMRDLADKYQREMESDIKKEQKARAKEDTDFDR